MGRPLLAFFLVAALAVALFVLHDPAAKSGGTPAPMAAPDPAHGLAVPESVDPAPTRDEARGPTCRVTGTVADRKTGAPIRGALVRAVDCGRTTRTGGRGAFDLPVVCGESESIRVEADGYPFATNFPDLVPGGAASPLVFRLRRGASVSGIVLDPDGMPVAGARVSESSNPDRTVTTGRNGTFRATGVRSGRATIVEARRAGWLPATSDVLRLELREERSGVILRLRRGERVGGTVRSWNGAPMAGVTVVAFDEGGSSAAVRAVTDPAGIFSLVPLAAGTWRLRATADGLPSARARIEVPVRDRVNLRFGGELSGRVVDSTGAPVVSGTIEAIPVGLTDGPKPNVNRTDRNGRFSFTLPWSPAFELRARWPESLVPLSPVRAAIGERDLVVRLPAPAMVSGRVVLPDGRVPDDFHVRVYRPNAGRPVDIGGRNGTFFGRGLAPGKARLVAAGRNHWAEPVAVELRSGKETANVRLRLRVYASLFVCIIGRDGKPVSRVDVDVRDFASGKRHHAAYIGYRGHARLAHVRAGRYLVHAHGSAGRAKPVEVRLDDGEEKRVTLVLDR